MTSPVRELDYQLTPMGELILRCRSSPHVVGGLVYEVKLGNEMLMSSSVNDSERALAQTALESWGASPCDVLIGGLGLGYTAAAALGFPQVRRVDVIEMLAPVIAWHRGRLVPAAGQLVDDSRCTLVEGDFFDLVAEKPREVSRQYDAILVDIDHSPDAVLHPRHKAFYTEPGLTGLATHLSPGGVFGLWSAKAPSHEFLRLLDRVFASSRVHEVEFYNPHVRESDINWIIVGHRQA